MNNEIEYIESVFKFDLGPKPAMKMLWTANNYEMVRTRFYSTTLGKWVRDQGFPICVETKEYFVDIDQEHNIYFEVFVVLDKEQLKMWNEQQVINKITNTYFDE